MFVDLLVGLNREPKISWLKMKLKPEGKGFPGSLD